MEEMMIMMASMMPFEELVRLLEASVSKYNQASLIGDAKALEEAKQMIVIDCQLILINDKTGGTPQGTSDMIKDFKQFSKVETLLKPNNN